MSRYGIKSLVVLLSLGLSLAACLITYNEDGVELQEPDDGTPRLQVTSPTPNEVVTDTVLQVRLEVRNFNLVPKWGQPNVTGEGHLHVTIDGNSITAEGEGVTTTSFGIDLSNLAPRPMNTHVLRIEARNNDRSLFDQIAPVVVTFATGTAGDGSGSGSGG